MKKWRGQERKKVSKKKKRERSNKTGETSGLRGVGEVPAFCQLPDLNLLATYAHLEYYLR